MKKHNNNKYLEGLETRRSQALVPCPSLLLPWYCCHCHCRDSTIVWSIELRWRPFGGPMVVDGGGRLVLLSHNGFILNNELVEKITYKEIKHTVVVMVFIESVEALKLLLCKPMSREWHGLSVRRLDPRWPRLQGLQCRCGFGRANANNEFMSDHGWP